MIVVEPRPAPSKEALSDALRAFGEKATAPVDPRSLDARDPRFIERVMPLMELLYDHYFRCETELEQAFSGASPSRA